MTNAALTVALLLQAAPPREVDAKVTEVTVYSDRAHVVRTGVVSLSGVERLALPLLLEGVDTSTLRLEAEGGAVQRIELVRIEAGELPMDEARRLLKEIEGVDDRLAAAQAERGALHAHAADLRRLSPSASPLDGERPPPRLNPSGWRLGLRFTSEQLERVQARTGALDEAIYRLQRDRQSLAERAAALGGERQSGHRVVATVQGAGPVKLSLRYAVGRARWYPTYDVQYLPREERAQISFVGLVSQETGEDWEEAALTLSTAVPAHAITMPKLLTWKLGERERFIPTPVAQARPAPPPPPPYPRAPEELAEQELLRSRLLQASAGARPATGKWQHRPQAAPPPPPAEPAPEAFLDQPRMAPSAAMEEARPATRPVTRGQRAPPASIPPAPSAAYLDVASTSQRPPPPSAGFALAPPVGWVPPSLPPDLPAEAAGGYDLSFASAQRETVQSGRGARRVALFSQTWPVAVERRLFPALAPDAYLVAELQNPSPVPLPAGSAQLFVGADPSGTARLSLVAPGERFTLPLGIDRALRPVRNVRTVQAEQGFILGREELSEYVVTTELVNPYPVAVKVSLVDQYPVTDDKDLEVRLLEVKPKVEAEDKVKGTLQWRLTVPPNGKVVTTFKYSLKRPKGYRLRQ